MFLSTYIDIKQMKAQSLIFRYFVISSAKNKISVMNIYESYLNLISFYS
jgi:hypothetical protein